LTDGTVRLITNSFKILVTARGGVTQVQNVQADIVVCKWETLTLTEPGRQLYEYHLSTGVFEEAISYPIESNFTSNDTDYCPPYLFSLTQNGGVLPSLAIPVDPQSAFYYKILSPGETFSGEVLQEYRLWNYPGSIDEYPFFLLAQTAGGVYAYKEIMMSVSEPCNDVLQ
jgi:hypothetical protein